MSSEELPPSIGELATYVVASCIRKWMAGQTLTESERAIVELYRVRNDQAVRSSAVRGAA